MRASPLLAALIPFAAVPAGAAAGSTLARSLSPRSSALSGAYSAVAGGLSSLDTNPAGLAGAKRPELLTSFTSGVLDDSFGFLGWAQPLPLGVLAAGLSYYDAGKVDLHFPNGTTSVRTAQRDFVGHLGWGVALPGGLAAGATGKFYRFELAQEARAAGVAGDVGAQWKTPLKGVSLGAAAQNLGAGVRYDRETEPLPATARGGVSWAWASREAKDTETTVAATRVLLSGEAIKERDVKTAGALGAEVAMSFSTDSAIALRAGWTLNSDAARLTVGVGIRERRWTLDYALDEKRTLGQTHHAGFGVRF